MNKWEWVVITLVVLIVLVVLAILPIWHPWSGTLDCPGARLGSGGC
jgi:hypothetical protein